MAASFRLCPAPAHPRGDSQPVGGIAVGLSHLSVPLLLTGYPRGFPRLSYVLRVEMRDSRSARRRCRTGRAPRDLDPLANVLDLLVHGRAHRRQPRQLGLRIRHAPECVRPACARSRRPGSAPARTLRLSNPRNTAGRSTAPCPALGCTTPCPRSMSAHGIDDRAKPLDHAASRKCDALGIRISPPRQPPSFRDP